MKCVLHILLAVAKKLVLKVIMVIFTQGKIVKFIVVLNEIIESSRYTDILFADFQTSTPQMSPSLE